MNAERWQRRRTRRRRRVGERSRPPLSCAAGGRTVRSLCREDQIKRPSSSPGHHLAVVRVPRTLQRLAALQHRNHAWPVGREGEHSRRERTFRRAGPHRPRLVRMRPQNVSPSSSQAQTAAAGAPLTEVSLSIRPLPPVMSAAGRWRGAELLNDAPPRASAAAPYTSRQQAQQQQAHLSARSRGAAGCR